MKTSSRERFKTIILIMLILSSMFLTYRLWFNGHNLFDILGVFEQTKKVFKNQNGLQYVYSPPKIWVNLGHSSHIVIRTNYDEYQPLQKEGVKIIRQLLSSQKHEELDILEWNTLLSSKSLFYSYETKLGINIMTKLFNASNPYIEGVVPYIKDIIIVQDDTISENIKCFLKDEQKGKIYCFKFSYDDGILNTLLNQIENQELSNYCTGYELEHKLINDDVLLTDDILVGKEVKLFNEINLESNNDIKRLTQGFFEKFNVVKNIEYKNDTKSHITQKEFIDRKRILKIYDNGLIEYSSAEIPNDKAQIDVLTALKKAVEFVENNLGFPENAFISEIKMIDPSHYSFAFDYMAGGLVVKLHGNNIPKHAIEIEVAGDIVSSYRRCVRTFTETKEVELNVINLKAINEAVGMYKAQINEKEMGKEIGNIELIYIDNGTVKTNYPYWYIQIGDKQYYISSVNKEN